jgi:uncharacterized protein YcfJ
MPHESILIRNLPLALGMAVTIALTGCSHGNQSAQAANMPANLTTTGQVGYGSAQAPAAAVSSATAPAGQAANAQPQFAQVVAVQPITQSVTTSKPHRVCKDEQVAVPETYKDKHQVGGAVVGGLVGALAGHQIGGGKGRTLATVGGAAAGAFAGHEIQKKHQEDNATKTEIRNVCRSVTEKTTTTQTVGYDVTYTLNGQAGHVRMDHDPGVGTGLPVQNGAVIAGNQQSGNYYH